MDVDNRAVLIPAYLDTKQTQWALLRYDPTIPGVIGTVWAGRIGAPVERWFNWTVNSDGNPVTIDFVTSPSFAARLCEFDRYAARWKLTTLSLASTAVGESGLVWDKARGGYLHAGISFSQQVTDVHLHRTRADGTRTSLVAVGAGLVAFFGGDLSGNGDWISASAVSGPFVVSRGAVSSFAVGMAPPPLVALDDVTFEKWAAAGNGLYCTQSPTTWTAGGVYFVDPTAAKPVVTTIWDRLQGVWPSGVFGREVTPLFERDLATFRTGKATWDVGVSPGSVHAGRSFVVAASLSGARPPVLMPDGREVYLVPDPLTALTVTGMSGPFLTRNIGTLGVRGTGIAKLDFRAVGPALNGLVIHLAAVVLDAAAPNGIAWVTEPWAFVVNVLP